MFSAGLRLGLFGVWALLGFAGCASLRGTDPSLLNHPAMDLHQSLTPARTTYLSPLGSGPVQAKNGGACATCAH